MPRGRHAHHLREGDSEKTSSNQLSMKAIRILLLSALAFCLVHAQGVAMACAAGYGKSDSPMAQGMNAGIFALLGVIGTVLCGAVSFFVFLARKSASVNKAKNNPAT